MKKLFPLLVAFFACSCAAKVVPVGGKYPDTPITVKTEKSFEEVWERVVDMFAQKGLSIKLIDKSSGIIISDKVILIATIEDTKGETINKDAEIVVAKYKDPGSGRYVPISGTSSGPYAAVMVPKPILGEWNIRVKKEGLGTSINVNLNNLVFMDQSMYAGRIIEQPVPITTSQFKTMGVFENAIINYINR